MTNDEVCKLQEEVAHARNRENRHLAEMGEMARELENIKNRMNVVEYRMFDLETKFSLMNKSRSSNKEATNG